MSVFSFTTGEITMAILKLFNRDHKKVAKYIDQLSYYGARG